MLLNVRCFDIRRALPVFLALVILLLALPGSAGAQNKLIAPPTPADSMQLMMGQMSGMMDVMYRKMAETMMEVTLEVLTRPETTDRLATFARNYYEALIRKGFSKEQALQIVAGAGIPGPGGATGQ